MGVTASRFTLPHYRDDGFNVGGIRWENYDLPAIEDEVNFTTLNFIGFGLTTVLLAYLTQIWVELNKPEAGFQAILPIRGSGYCTLQSLGLRNKIIGVRMNIVPPPPDDSDLIYGQLPIYYLGMAGYGGVRTQGTAINTGLGLLQIGITNDEPYFAAPIFINHLTQTFPLPKGEGEHSLFWWHLKEGLRGFITVTEEYTDEPIQCTYQSGGDVTQRFNPKLSYPWQGGMFDGGLNPTQNP